MKQQIRLNVFETNSSTQHALVIKSRFRDRRIEDGIPEGIKLPEKIQLYSMYSSWADAHKNNKSTSLTKIENRINYLLWSHFC